ncbi:hypothetical protein J6590_092329 [Homalodisca vitripennis]|nr:hypothetical protein J6590_092329 [Homalodisca vitripennis]
MRMKPSDRRWKTGEEINVDISHNIVALYLKQRQREVCRLNNEAVSSTLVARDGITTQGILNEHWKY